MARVAGIIAVVLILAAAGYFLFFRPAAEPPLGSGPIVAFGDSLTSGAGAQPGEDYVSRLAQASGKEILNEGRSGDTSADALARLDNGILNKRPSLVIVFLGGNDLLQGIPPEDTFRNVGTIVARIKESGAKVLLVGWGAGPKEGVYEEGFGKIAQNQKVHYVPGALRGIWGDPELMSDEIHPNGAGYAIMSDKIEQEFLKMVR